MTIIENKNFKKKNKKNYVFAVTTCCQGQPFVHYYNTLIGGLFGYAKEYLKKEKYHTMNFTLDQEFLWDGKLKGIEELGL